jgi:hypothetical protein
MPQRANGGLSRLTIDNTSGGADVHVKLCHLGRDPCNDLRQVFIPVGTAFTLRNIRPGQYDIRYRDLETGKIEKSQAIVLREIEETDGVQFSVVTLTLYRVASGNTTFSQIPEGQF